MINRRTCFVCGHPARWTDANSGEPLCTVHYHPHRKTVVRLPITVRNDWTRLAHIQAWMSGSAYASDRAMAKRLAKVKRP